MALGLLVALAAAPVAVLPAVRDGRAMDLVPSEVLYAVLPWVSPWSPIVDTAVRRAQYEYWKVGEPPALRRAIVRRQIAAMLRSPDPVRVRVGFRLLVAARAEQPYFLEQIIEAARSQDARRAAEGLIMLGRMKEHADVAVGVLREFLEDPAHATFVRYSLGTLSPYVSDPAPLRAELIEWYEDAATPRERGAFLGNAHVVFDDHQFVEYLVAAAADPEAIVQMTAAALVIHPHDRVDEAARQRIMGVLVEHARPESVQHIFRSLRSASLNNELSAMLIEVAHRVPPQGLDAFSIVDALAVADVTEDQRDELYRRALAVPTLRLALAQRIIGAEPPYERATRRLIALVDSGEFPLHESEAVRLRSQWDRAGSTLSGKPGPSEHVPAAEPLPASR